MRDLSHPLRLRSLRHVALETSAFSDSVEFYGELWGLERVATTPDASGPAYFRGTGSEHHLLELHPAETNGIHHIAWSLASPAHVDAATEHLIEHGVTILEEPVRSTDPGLGYRVRFLDLEGRTLEISAETSSVAPRSLDAPVPHRLAHVVLNTVDIDAACAFYTEVLGFKVTDWSEHQMVFLRCNADHHSVAFNQANWTSLNHVAYEMLSVDHYMRGIGRLKQHGVEPLWGPGRHGPGNNTFAYFADPAGLVPEFTSEVEQINDDNWLPRVWQRVPDQSDLWGTAGPPSALVRERMAGVPDPKSEIHAVQQAG
jgi:catechol 2,3-dioxygenase-like lactoylglutathione lyase family enzyme